MPYTIVETDGRHCVYKEDVNGAATGESLGCHETAREAGAQIMAIETNESKRVKAPDKYGHIDFTPPEGMRDAARNGLERHEAGESGDGLKPETVRRANQIAAGEALTPDHVREMSAWFARHGENRQDPGTPWYAAWQLWGGDPGERWSGARVRQMDAADEEKAARAGDWKAYGVPGYRAGTDLKNCRNCASWQNAVCVAFNAPVHRRGYCEMWMATDTPTPDTPDSYEDAIDGYERGEMKIYGGALQVKSITADTVTVAGYGVLFGGTDLDGDTFTKSTAFALERMKRVPVFYDHAMDDDLDDTPLGYVKEMHQDDTGLWIEAQLNRNQRYTQAVMRLIESRAVGWSSGSVSHLVRREGGAIRSWPIVEFSLTPTPAESRLSGAVSAKNADPALPVDIDNPDQFQVEDYMSAESIAGLQEQITALTAAITNMKTPADQQAEDQPAKANPAIDELKAQNKALTDQVQQIMNLLDTEPAQRIGYVTPDGGTADRNVKSFGDFVKAIGRRDHKRLTEVYGARKALEENSGVTGGYLVPTQFVNQLTEYAAEMEIVKPRAFRVDMTAREAEIPAIDYANTAYSAGDTAFTAGLVMEWTAERKKIPDTQPKFRQMQLEAHKMSGIVPVSNELLNDSGQALEQLLVRLFGTAVAFTEDYAFLQGDGNGKPLGVLNAPATITTGTALTAAAPTVAQLSAMYSRLMQQSKENAVWVVHQLLTDALMSINATASSNTMLTWLPDIRGRIQPVLFGHPVLFTEKLPTSFANGGLILADFQQYVVGNRQEIEIAMSEHAGFNQDETQWRCIARCDGQPYMNGPVKVGSGANDTVSAFVKSK